MAVENKTFQGVYASFCLCPSSQNYVKIDTESGEKMLCTQKMSSKRVLQLDSQKFRHKKTKLVRTCVVKHVVLCNSVAIIFNGTFASTVL